MKSNYKSLMIITFAFASAFNCSATTELLDVSETAPQWYIRPFGDSITYGVGFASPCELFTPPATGGGYRAWMTLFAQSPAVGLKFKTVGNKIGGSNMQQWKWKKVPNNACVWEDPFNGICTQFHDGYPGWRTDQLMGIASIKIKAPQPHVALIHAGTNDFLQGLDAESAWANLQQILRNMRTARGNNNTKLVVAQILRVADWYTNPFTKCHADCVNKQIKRYNGYIAQNVNDPTWTNSSNVDMGGVGFLSKEQYCKDGVHPNCQGYVKMACTWLAHIGRNPPSSCGNPAALCKNFTAYNCN